jgi:hypothetical protein
MPLMFCCVLGPATARSLRPPAIDHPIRDSVPLATITTDTGAFAPGNKDFTRFTTPGQCLGAVGVASDLLRRSVATQVSHVLEDSAAAGDPLPAGAVAVAQACLARLTTSGTAAGDLPDFFRLALLAGNDSVARTAVARQLALATDAASRAAVLQDAIDGYLDAEPAHVAAAESVAAQMDALGKTMTVERLNGHQSLLQFARRKFDEPHMRQEAERIIAIGQEVPATTIQLGKEAVFWAYAALGEIAYLEHPDSVMAITARAKRDLGRFGPMPNGIPVHLLILLKDFSTLSLPVIRNNLLPFNADQYAGRSLPPLAATYWFPKAPTSWPPGNGRPSLIVYGGWMMNRCARDDDGILDGPLFRGYGCRELYTYVPLWAKKYGDQLAITLVSQTGGRAARSAELSPAQEADSLRWFFLDHLELPVTVGVVEASVKTLPVFDGRQFRTDTSFYGNLLHRSKWGFDSNLITLFYGSHGTLLYVSDESNTTPVLRRLIDREMRTVPTSSSTGSSHE